MDRTLLLAMPKKVRGASEFGERLTALGKARGLTQVQLADNIDIRLVNSLVMAKAATNTARVRRAIG